MRWQLSKRQCLTQLAKVNRCRLSQLSGGRKEPFIQSPRVSRTGFPWTQCRAHPVLSVHLAEEFGIAQIVTETVVVKTREVPPHPRPLAVRSVALGLAFAAFLAVGGLVPGGLVVAASGDAAHLSTQGLAAFIVVNAAIAGVIGYRLAGLLSPHRFDRIVRFVAVLQYAVAVGVAAGLLRSMALPRLFIPALLTLVVYLVMAVRESPERVTLNKRLLQELAVLALAASAAIAWGLMAR